jgi:hypothetical protein
MRIVLYENSSVTMRKHTTPDISNEKYDQRDNFAVVEIFHDTEWELFWVHVDWCLGHDLEMKRLDTGPEFWLRKMKKRKGSFAIATSRIASSKPIRNALTIRKTALMVHANIDGSHCHDHGLVLHDKWDYFQQRT